VVEDLECTLKFQDQCEDGKAITQHKVKGKEGWPKEQASEAAQMQMPNRTNSSGATEIAATRSTASARQTLLLQTRTTMA
jgi:hypothetical protein